MKIRMPHTPYIANKIALDLLNSGFITLNSGFEPVVKVAENLLVEDVEKEMALDEKVNELIDENSDEIEFMQIDRRNMFWLIKKKLAKEENFILTYEDRYNEIAHKILEKLWKDGLVEYSISENRVKNIIFNAIEDYLRSYEELEDIVIDKIGHYKRKLIPGTDEYELIFERLYQEELKRKGMLK